jgi:hypothetical protein
MRRRDAETRTTEAVRVRDLERARSHTVHRVSPADVTGAVTYDQAIAAAAQILADARARMATLTARQAAEEAYVPGGPSVEELEAKIRRLRAASASAAA